MGNASLLPTEEKALEYRRRYRGLIGLQSKIPIKDKAMLSLVYTPGVGDACLAVEREENEAMKLAAAKAIAGIVQESELEPEHIIPASMDFRVPPAVAAAVAQAAMDSGVARRKVDPERVAESTRRFIYEGVLDQI